MIIPILNLQAQYESIKDEINEAIGRVLTGGSYILGPNVAALEEEVASFCGVKYGIGVASGTDALLLSLMAFGIEAGDEVITTPYTFFATAETISWLGATPVFVDINPRTYNLDISKIEAKITEKTKAIIPVHLFGQMCNMDGIMALAKKYKLFVIEDACQAIGASHKGRPAGSMGHAACFSFFPSKNLGGYGDGGMVVTNDNEIKETIRILRVHGSKRKYFHDLMGVNSRLDELQASVLRVKLKYLNRWNSIRQEKARIYNAMLSGTNITTPYVDSGNNHIYHLYVIRSKTRTQIIKKLTDQKIGHGVYYPLPLHLQPVFGYLGYREGDLPEAELAAQETLALPLYPELTIEKVGQVVKVIV